MKLILSLLLCTIYLFAYEDLVAKEEEANKKQLAQEEEDVTDLNLIQDSFLINSKDIGISSINNNVQILEYEENKTIQIRARLSIKNLIVLDKEESIRAFIIGNDFGFKAEIIKTENNINSNMLSIIPKFARIDTNLNIISSSGRVYNFYIYSTIIKYEKLPHFTTYVKLKELDKFKDNIKNVALKKEEDIKPTFNLNNIALSSLNFDYTISKDIGIEAVFSNIDKTFIKIKKGVVVSSLIDSITKEELSFTKNKEFIIIDKAVSTLEAVVNVWSGKSKAIISKNKKYIQNFIKDEIYINLFELNFLYTIYSEKENNIFMPIIVFSDKKFTYFQFDTSRADKKYPNVYRVVDKIDNPMSTSISGNFLIAKDLSSKFSLKLGEETICISKGNS